MGTKCQADCDGHEKENNWNGSGTCEVVWKRSTPEKLTSLIDEIHIITTVQMRNAILLYRIQHVSFVLGICNGNLETERFYLSSTLYINNTRCIFFDSKVLSTLLHEAEFVKKNPITRN